MQSFKIKPDGFKEIRNKSLKRMIPTTLIALSIGVWISSINSKYEGTGGTFYFAFIPILLGFSVYRGLKKQKALFESYELTISDNLIVREQLNTRILPYTLKKCRKL
jgi:hypothetical protein